MGSTIQPGTAIVAAGAGKIFIGEITELALDVKRERNEDGPVQPSHIREAYRRYKEKTGLMAGSFKKQLFR